MTKRELLRRIEALEARVRELEARPPQVMLPSHPRPIEPINPNPPWWPPVWYTTCGTHSTGEQQ